MILLLNLLAYLLTTALAQNQVTCSGRRNTLPILTADAQAAIDRYCYQPFYLDPNIRQNRFTQTPINGISYENFYVGNRGYVVEMRATYAADQTGCATKGRFSTQGNECRRALAQIADQCMSIGGGQVLEKTQSGCIVWSLYGVQGAV